MCIEKNAERSFSPKGQFEFPIVWGYQHSVSNNGTERELQTTGYDNYCYYQQNQLMDALLSVGLLFLSFFYWILVRSN
jgi:hypothetical protein